MMAEVLSLSIGTTRDLRDGEHVLPNRFGFGENFQHFLQIPIEVTKVAELTTSGE